MRHPTLIALSHDHHHGLALALRCRKQALGQIKPVGTEGLRERAKEFRDFYAANLARHFRAEEEVLFPFMRLSLPESEPLIEQLLLDHEQIRSALAQFGAESGLGKRLFELGDLLERHIRKEERELFPLYEKNVGRSEADAIGERIGGILGKSS